MKANSHWHNSYEFGDFVLDAEHLMLYKRGAEVDLPPKAVETLLALVEKQNEVVSKDELMAVIWSDTVVEESNLSRYIHLLRHTLGVRQDGGEFIETFRRRGYRFNCEARVTRREGTKLPSEGLVGSGIAPRVETDQTTEPAETSGAGRKKPPGVTRNWGRLGSLRGRLILSGIFAVVISVVGAMSFLDYEGASGVLSDKDVILVADFENRTSDPVFDGTLRLGLIMQLQQSPFLKILSTDEIQSSLHLMKLAEDSGLSRSVAREMCLRRGLKAFVYGSIVSMGGDYVITLEAVGAEDGESIAIQQVQASGKEGVLRALSAAASSLRARLGEELAMIKKLDTPLEVSTRSLEALRFHNLAWKELTKGNDADAIPYFRRAIEIDPDFASAYGDLAVAYRNIGSDAEAVAAIKMAISKLDNASELERLNISDLYHGFVTYRLEERLKILGTYKRLYPRDYRASLRLATIYLMLGDYEETINAAKEAVSLGTSRSYYEWGEALLKLGKYDEARKVLETGVRSGYRLGMYHEALAEVGVVTEDQKLVEREIAALDAGRFGVRSVRLRARLAFSAGKMREGLELYQEALANASLGGQLENAKGLQAEMEMEASLIGNCRPVVSLSGKVENFVEAQGAAANASFALARCGRKNEAQRLLGKLLALYPDGTFPNQLTGRLVRAAIALSDNKPEEALTELSDVPPGLGSRSRFRVSYLRGSAFLRLGQFEAADREFQKILANRGESPISQLYPLSFLGRARALRSMGKIEESREAYRRFLSLWRGADQDLPVVVSAKREFAALG